MRYLIIVPARGGSKSIPKKNIFPINNKPLLEYTLDVIQEAALTDTDVAVSTDAEDIKEVARKYKNIDVIDRPADISGDTASTEDVLLHAISIMEKRKKVSYNAVLTLQPTSPLRKAKTLKEFIKIYEENLSDFDALLSLHETRADYWINTKTDKYERLYKNAPRRRQERKPIYVENSAYYITSVESLKKTHSVLGNKVNGFVISETEGIDINEPIDIIVAESLLNQESR